MYMLLHFSEQYFKGYRFKAQVLIFCNFIPVYVVILGIDVLCIHVDLIKSELFYPMLGSVS